MNVSNTVIPFAPEVNALQVAEGDLQLYFLGRQFRAPKNGRGTGYMIFHILFVKDTEFRILVPSFRLMGGKIYPPQARLFRNVFDHFHCGITLRAMIHAGVNSFKDRLPLEPNAEKATGPLVLTPDLLAEYNKITEDKGEVIL